MMKLFKVEDRFFESKQDAKEYRNDLLRERKFKRDEDNPDARPPVVVERGPDHRKEV